MADDDPRGPTQAQNDRAAGVLLGTATGDALGAGYEFGPPLSAETPVEMRGGGPFDWEPGEWTDDTSMAIVIARTAHEGADLGDENVQDRIAGGWYRWAQESKDVGVQTRAVLDAAHAAACREASDLGARHLREAARAHHERTERSGGNGSLMRTAPVALAYLHDEDALVTVAQQLSELTHVDPEAGEACVLWCLAVRRAVLTGRIDMHQGMEHLDHGRRGVWMQRLADAQAERPAAFNHNGWVVQAFQGAWSAISHTPGIIDPPEHDTSRAHQLRAALEAAVRGGNDTDTVAAIAGGLAGAACGAAAVPSAWRARLHGWPGYDADDLVRLGVGIAQSGNRTTHTAPPGSRTTLPDSGCG